MAYTFVVVRWLTSTMPAKNAGDAAKAFRLRKLRSAGKALKPIDALWLADFEEEQQRDPKRRTKTKSWGASAAGKRVRLEIDEHAESVGTGTAASEAATAALMVKEEGRRLDTLTVNAVGALHEAVETYKAICLDLRKSTSDLHTAHVEMFRAWQGEAIGRTETEIALREAAKSGDDDEVKGMLMAIVAQKLGLPGLAGAAAKGTTKGKAAK